ncbi:MAG: aromatic acid exporter family protein [Ruminococcus sp.]
MNPRFYTDLFDASKIAAGCVLSILLASYIGLKYSLTSGLITILSIQNTKVETIGTALKRLGAYFAAMLIAAICFYLIGYNTWAFGIYIFIFVILCYKLQWKNAIVPISVLVTHLLSEKSIALSLMLNEFLIFAIGAGMGILINLHLHKSKLKMQNRRQILDDEIKRILERMSERILMDDKSDYNANCFDRIQEMLFEAEKVAHENRNNTFSSETYDEDYLKMRRNQCNVLYEMYKSVIKMNATPKQAHILSDFLHKISMEYHEKNDVKALMKELDEIFHNMSGQNMPENRTEFENRALLFALMLQIQEFLSIKYEFAQEKL